jgi:glutathione S-transferase
MILYGTSLSPFVRKVLVALAEKEVAFEHRPLRFHDPDPDFQAASALGKIPAIEDEGFRLADSTAIIAYLDRKHPTPAMIPSDPHDSARAVWFDKFNDTELLPKVIKPFVHRFVMPNLLGKEGDEAVVAKALDKEMPPLFDYLEGEIEGPYLVGGAFSLADISVTTAFHNLRLVGESVDADRWPKLAGYVAATLARPSFLKAIAAPTS